MKLGSDALQLVQFRGGVFFGVKDHSVHLIVTLGERRLAVGQELVEFV